MSPPPECVREAIRDIVAHCIYGVEKNPLAVELCRVALWLEAHYERKPLTFLDHCIRCGDSLVGVMGLAVLQDGIPDEAFEPISDDNRVVARSLKHQNRDERQGQYSLRFDASRDLKTLAEVAQQLDTVPDDTPAQIREKALLFAQREKQTQYERTACNLWTAAFFQRMTNTTP